MGAVAVVTRAKLSQAERSVNPTVEMTEPHAAHFTHLNLDGHVSYVHAIVFTFPVSDILPFILVFIPLLCT